MGIEKDVGPISKIVECPPEIKESLTENGYGVVSLVGKITRHGPGSTLDLEFEDKSTIRSEVIGVQQPSSDERLGSIIVKRK